jgi:hypothetical protein
MPVALGHRHDEPQVGLDEACPQLAHAREAPAHAPRRMVATFAVMSVANKLRVERED